DAFRLTCTYFGTPISPFKLELNQLKFKYLLQSSVHLSTPGLHHVTGLQPHLAEAFLHRGPYRCGLSRLLSTRSDSRPTHQPVSSVHVDERLASKLIRNVGVIAHIDAGKTTTTERMLYFARKLSPTCSPLF
ncbi:hypothetical protein AHF37_07826, partial [Paragonimus kellicotti]